MTDADRARLICFNYNNKYQVSNAKSRRRSYIRKKVIDSKQDHYYGIGLISMSQSGVKLTCFQLLGIEDSLTLKSYG